MPAGCDVSSFMRSTSVLSESDSSRCQSGSIARVPRENDKSATTTDKRINRIAIPASFWRSYRSAQDKIGHEFSLLRITGLFPIVSKGIGSTILCSLCSERRVYSPCYQCRFIGLVSVEVYDGNGDDLSLCRLIFVSVERRQKKQATCLRVRDA